MRRRWTALAGAGPGVVEAQSQDAGPGEADYVDVCVWQHVSDPSLLFISARPAGSRWAAFGTVRLPLDDGRSRDGNHRFGDITLPARRTPRGFSLVLYKGGSVNDLVTCAVAAGVTALYGRCDWPPLYSLLV